MMTMTEIEKHLKAHLDPKRLAHSYGVQEAAMALARHWGGDVEKCGLAGLIHDAGKWPEAVVIKECEARGIPITEEDRLCPQVIHAYLSKAIAQEIYGITDEEVLAAVANHCLGASDMGLTEKIVFLADMIEAGRQGEWLAPLRKLAYEDLDKAMYACYESTIANNLAKGRHVHGSVWIYKKKLEDKINGS